MIQPIPYYGLWNPKSTVVPKLYWGAYSQEQRIHALCREYAKLIAYDDALAEKLNDTAKIVNDLEKNFPELIDEKTREYINELIENGQLREIILEAVTRLLGNNEIQMRRIGRKVFSDSTRSLQGSCMNGDDVFYILWNSANTDNANKLVKMNLETGLVIAEKEVTLGWCNSVCYDGAYYLICVRGNNEGNNDIIVRYDEELEYVDTINLGYNANAIAYHEGKYYVVPEDNWVIQVYDEMEPGAVPSSAIAIAAEKLYTQNILVDDNTIYILSSRPNCILTFDMTGTQIGCYVIPDYMDNYKYGESQAVMKHDGQLIVTSSVISPNDRYCHFAIGQFFNAYIDGMHPGSMKREFVETLYCDPNSAAYNPNGTQESKFANPMEATWISNNQGSAYIVIDGSGKEYGFFSPYIFEGKLRNATIADCRLEYCDLFLEAVVIENGDVFVRDSEITMDNVTLGSGTYGLVLNRNANAKLSNITHGNYTNRAYSVLAGCNLTVTDSTTNRFIPRNDTPSELYSGSSFNIASNPVTISAEAKAILTQCNYIEVEIEYAGISQVCQCYRNTTDTNNYVDASMVVNRSDRAEVASIRVKFDTTGATPTASIIQARVYNTKTDTMTDNSNEVACRHLSAKFRY